MGFLLKLPLCLYQGLGIQHPAGNNFTVKAEQMFPCIPNILERPSLIEPSKSFRVATHGLNALLRFINGKSN